MKNKEKEDGMAELKRFCQLLEIKHTDIETAKL